MSAHASYNNNNNNDGNEDDDNNIKSNNNKSKSSSNNKNMSLNLHEAGLDLDIAQVDIAKVLNSTGPVVKCVLLKHMRRDGKDGKPHPAQVQQLVRNPNDQHIQHQRVVLTEDIEEIEIDTTPHKNHIQQVLGGSITFLGQYPSEGTMVIARRDGCSCFEDDDDEENHNLDDLSIHELRQLCRDANIDTANMLEKAELVDALINAQLPMNPHQLQPPLDKVRVRGDILLIRVADNNNDENDDDNDDNNNDDTEEQQEKQNEKQSIQFNQLSNEEFFLNYTKQEYIAFASRTDVVAPEPPEDDEEDEEQEADEDEEEEEGEADEEEDDDDDDDDEDYNPVDEELEEKQTMLNLVMREVLRAFRNENGRGPDTEELLELRSQVAAQLDVQVPTLETLEQEFSTSTTTTTPSQENKKKRKEACDDGEDDNDDDSNHQQKPSKKVKFVSPPKEKDSNHDDQKEDDEEEEADDEEEEEENEEEEEDDDDDQQEESKLLTPTTKLETDVAKLETDAKEEAASPQYNGAKEDTGAAAAASGTTTAIANTTTTAEEGNTKTPPDDSKP